jgi:hypothetical protein
MLRFIMSTTPVYWSISVFTVLLGLFLIGAPASWFGPTWDKMPFPYAGFALGMACIVLGYLQTLALGLEGDARILSLLYLISGVLFWSVGCTFIMEGVHHRTGMMEAPFILYVGGHCFAHSASLWAYFREQRAEQKDVKEHQLQVHQATPDE